MLRPKNLKDTNQTLTQPPQGGQKTRSHCMGDMDDDSAESEELEGFSVK